MLLKMLFIIYQYVNWLNISRANVGKNCRAQVINERCSKYKG